MNPSDLLQKGRIVMSKQPNILLIVTDQIAHQDVENVVVDGNGLFEARHGEVRGER